MSRVNKRFRHPSKDEIKRCEICGNDLTGTEKSICDTCESEMSEGVKEILKKGKLYV